MADIVRARIARRCDSCARSVIKPGDYYLRHTAFPGDDSGIADYAKHTVKSTECRNCAARYGRPVEPTDVYQYA